MTPYPASFLGEARAARLSGKRRRRGCASATTVLVGLVAAFAAPAASEPAAPDAGAALAAEVRRRNDELVNQGFNLTYGLTVDAAHPVRLELLLPPSDDELEISSCCARPPAARSLASSRSPTGSARPCWCRCSRGRPPRRPSTTSTCTR
jgi:hypothetical protein